MRVTEQPDDGLPWSESGKRVRVGEPAPRTGLAHGHIVPKIQIPCMRAKHWGNEFESITGLSSLPTLFREEPKIVTELRSPFGLAQAVGPSQLTEQHRDELLPTAHSSGMPLGFEVAHHALEVRPRNRLANLTEQAVKSVHVEPFRCRPKQFGSHSTLHGRARRLLC